MELNAEQQLAVTTIEGPLLVLAGPGTGKTQLLSERVAYILANTDTLPSNILCVTFTESAARNMRERLLGIIGDAAHQVRINTYHGFGSDIIREYPEYFSGLDLETGQDTRLEKPIDEITQIQIASALLAKSSYSNNLKRAKNPAKTLIQIINDLKQYGLIPDDLRQVQAQNLDQIKFINPIVKQTFTAKTPRTIAAADSFYSGILTALVEAESIHSVKNPKIVSLAKLAATELEIAFQAAKDQNKTTPLTGWKNKWILKDSTNEFTFTSLRKTQLIGDLTTAYEQYNQALAEHNYYDYSDMILKASAAIQEQDELRYNLQERYQYVLLDEFQDTNPAQFNLIDLITSHPVNEGRPNIMAVGDDDQAIYAFQGADIGNMQNFVHKYRQPKIISLKENYRSHADIVDIAHGVSEQIETRIHHQFEGVTKILQAVNKNLPKQSQIERHEFSSNVNEYAWLAKSVSNQISSGVEPKDIAILAPKHSLLGEIMPFLNQLEIPVAYEKREDILNTSVIFELEQSIKLLLALQEQNQSAINELMPVVLSFQHWQIDPVKIWKVNWQKSSKDEQRSWPEVALDDESLNVPINFFLGLSSALNLNKPLEHVLDYLLGQTSLVVGKTEITSPYKEFYTSEVVVKTEPYKLYQTLTYLSVIREKLRSYSKDDDSMLYAQDFLNLIAAYRQAEVPLINYHPVALSSNSVQLMTAFKAKGLEFKHVYIPNLADSIWGPTTRGGSSSISLPLNLEQIRFNQGGIDERLRVFYVAITRAQVGLHLSSHLANTSGKQLLPLRYIDNLDINKNTKVNNSTPEISADEHQANIATGWFQRTLPQTKELLPLLEEKLSRYKLSPTHLNTLIDPVYGGLHVFLINTIMRFPSAPTQSNEYGNAIHTTLEWINNQVEMPTTNKVIDKFNENISLRYLTKEQKDNLKDRGEYSLKLYLNARPNLKTPGKAEVDFNQSGVVVGNARISGKIDFLEIDEKLKTIRIIDYKTSKPLKRWDGSLKDIKYKQQLYMYKILVESDPRFKTYKILDGRIEFIEPDADGNIAPALILNYTQESEDETRQLISIIWQGIQTLKLPDSKQFEASDSGARDFIQQLLSKTK